MNGEFSAHELSDPNPPVYILFTYHSNSWKGFTRRHHPTIAVSLGEVLLSELSFFALQVPSHTASVQSGAGTQVKPPQTSSATRRRTV